MTRILTHAAFLLAVCLASSPLDANDVFISFVDDLFGNGNTRDPFEERIETDRHDFTQSTRTVGRGVFQIEAGYSYYYKDQEEEIETEHATPEMVARIGLSDDIEFRIRFNNAWESTRGEESISGSEDTRFGFKLRTTEQQGWIPESACEILFSAPTGGAGFTTGRWETGFDYIYGWKLTEKAEIYGSTGVFSNGLRQASLRPDFTTVDRFNFFTQSVALGYELTENSAFYSEFFGFFSKGREEEVNPIFFNIGVDYYLTHNAVFDIRIGKGLNGDADDLFAGIGGGIRF